jgi:hypothetical protein
MRKQPKRLEQSSENNVVKEGFPSGRGANGKLIKPVLNSLPTLI